MAEVGASSTAGIAVGEELFFPAGGHCFGCSSDNPAGLRLRFFRDPHGVRCETTVAPAYQGAPTVVHGGIQAVLLDETCCAAAYFTTGGFVVTGALDLRYRRPCPIGRPLVVMARIVADEGRFLRIRAEIREGGDGDPVTLAEGKFYPNPVRTAGWGRSAKELDSLCDQAVELLAESR